MNYTFKIRTLADVAGTKVKSIDTLLHQDLRVIGYNISINNRAKGNVVACWLDVLIYKLLVMFLLQAHHQLHCVLQVAAHLTGQHAGVLGWLKTDGPARQSCAALSDGSLEQAWRHKQQRGNEEASRQIFGALMANLH